ncbi:MAG: ATP-binding cassette domain-containing protein [Candidatus Pacebacteria bacterium]|nr:ATP-binding cassette domain-containing protein [Candidatus Paceibacterota bacterium]MCF7857345.1 ATP-binding cassette domain-containing protein [Candidatus Paceibacterota bacterium]
MSREAGLITFSDVSFEYTHNKPILIGANFVIRRGAKFTLMGQNGAGKSTIFDLITGTLRTSSGDLNVMPRTTIAVSRQVIPREELSLTIKEFFEKCFTEKMYDIDPKIDAVLEVVNFATPHDRLISSFSGGQQARLLLASALIQNPDLLLLDEPTNNLDVDGIEHLTEFLRTYKKTVVVISHDADFLNAFTHGVLYLDVHTHTVEQYDGNYHDVVREIALRIEKENRKNAQYAKEIQANKDKANFFAMKGGQMRLVAKRMREKAEDYEENKVDVRREDKTIRPFVISIPKDIPPKVLTITSFKVIRNHKPTEKKCDITLKKGWHLQLVGPNGIGKSTLLETLASGHAKGETVSPQVKIGYYRQDFSTLNFDDTVFDALMSVMERKIEEDMRSCAAGFLLGQDVMRTKIGSLSEGQKGLVAFAQLVLMKPGLLILDEPTNHINFRHLPVIAEALNKYEGAMILVSHVPDFVEKIRIDEVLDLGKK